MNEPKTVTNLVKSIRRALKADHAIDVPHTALRSSYLKALGENPHAFSKKPVAAATAPKSLPAPARQRAAVARLKLHLVGDDVGCLEVLALDEDGEHPVPEEFEFLGATVLSVTAEVPRISKYGLPGYLSDTRGFFARYGLRLADGLKPEVTDLGDDSGDAVTIVIALNESERTELLLRMMREEGLTDEVAYYVAEQYQLLLHQESANEMATWFLRYLGTDEEFWFAEASPELARQVRPLPAEEPMPEGLKHIKALTFEAFLDASVRNKRVEGAFQVESGTGDRVAILYLDKFSTLPFSQDVWFEHNADRNTVTYVLRVVDHVAGEALAECQTELNMARAAFLLDQSIEQQLGLSALADERARHKRSRWN